MERNPEFIADTEDTFIPTVEVIFPYEKLSVPFAKAIKTYLVLDEEALLKAAKEAANATEDDNKFLDVKFEELFNIPVTDGNAYNAKVAQYTKEGRVDSSGSQLAIVSIDLDYEAIEAPTMIISVPAPIPTVTSSTPNYVQSPPTVTTNPQYGLPTAPAINNTNILETLLNTQAAVTIAGNIFSKGASFGPSGGNIISAFFALPVRSGSSEDRTSPTVVTLNTAEGNHLNLYLATAGGHQMGDYEYILDHAVPHLLNDPEYDVVQIGQTKIFSDNFVYSVTNSHLETNIGTLTFEITDDVPVATNQNGSTITEANILTIGTAQSNVPAILTGSLIDPPTNRFGADGGTVTNVTIPNGITQFGLGSLTVFTAEGNTLTVNQTTGIYTYTLANPLHNTNNQPIVEVFTYEFTDGDGSIASANLSITINDDIPIATEKTNSASETLYFVNGSEVATGNLITDNNGFGISLFGADGGVISAVNGATDASDGQVDGIIEVATTYGDITVYITAQSGHQVGDYEYRIDGAKTVLANDNLITVIDTINYVLTDNDGSTDNADLLVTITLNQAPTAVDDTGQTDENVILNVLAVNGVLINDTDPNPGDTKAVSAVEGNAANVGVPFALISTAIVQLEADGAYSYNPNDAFNYLAVGSQTTDAFSYTMRDAEGLTSDATVTITINGVNNAPVAVDDSNTTHGNIVINVNTVNDPNNLLINDTDDTGDTFVISAVNGLAGNVGKSFAWQVAEENYDHYVIELSSFQLDGMYSFKADIGILLNITPDHLDRYEYSLQNYINSKFRILQNQTKNDAFIYCADDTLIETELLKLNPVAQCYPFSIHKEEGMSAFIKDNQIQLNIQNKLFTMSIFELALQGKHNLYNSMAAGVAARILDIRKEVIRDSFADFRNAEHRMEFVTTVHGVDFINDSKLPT